MCNGVTHLSMFSGTYRYVSLHLSQCHFVCLSQVNSFRFCSALINIEFTSLFLCLSIYILPSISNVYIFASFSIEAIARIPGLGNELTGSI